MDRQMTSARDHGCSILKVEVDVGTRQVKISWQYKNIGHQYGPWLHMGVDVYLMVYLKPVFQNDAISFTGFKIFKNKLVFKNLNCF